MDTLTIVCIGAAVLIALIIFLHCYSTAVRYQERRMVCQAMQRAFDQCPKFYAHGAGWLSDQFLVEMQLLGVDLKEGNERADWRPQ